MDIYIEKQQITVVLLCILMLNLSIFLLSILPFLLLKKEVEKVNDSIFRVAYWLLEATKPKWAIDKLHKLMTNKKWVAILIYTIVAVFIFYFIIVGWGRIFEIGYWVSGIETHILENKMNLVYHFIAICVILIIITYVEYVFAKIRLLYGIIMKIILTLLYTPSFVCITYSLINKIEADLRNRFKTPIDKKMYSKRIILWC